ncbi:MAG: carbon storage regulator [Dehalococcoidia bacterium]
MLVLTRKIDQGIVIAGNIYIKVLGVERDRVKIGISAPLDIAVLRQELIEREGAANGEPADTKENGQPKFVAHKEQKRDAS